MQEIAQNDKQSETPTVAPKHPLAEAWHSFVLFNNAFLPDGDLDLSNMSVDGILTNGTHVPTGDKVVGQAKLIVSPLGGTAFAVHLETEPKTAVYNGVVVFEAGQKVTIAGGFRFMSEERAKLVNELTQDEGVWVITKP
jgi:hypothetical protein